MKIQSLLAYFTLVVLSQTAFASELQTSSDLNAERNHVIREYIQDLERADYQAISSLFEDGSTLISTSRGNINAKEFFRSFFPNIESASTEFHQAFVNQVDGDRYAARFHLNYTLKNGEKGNGEYVDEFVFASNSSKLSHVYMFENLKFNSQ